MRIRPAPRAAGRLGLAVAFLLAACTAETPSGEVPSPVDTAPSATAAPDPTPREDPAAAALTAYQGYLDALTAALAAGDPDAPELAQHATGPALETARQQLQANTAGGVIATGTIQPAAIAAEVTVEGDRATIQDCLLNDLAQVRAANPDEVVQVASGNRQPLTATLTSGEDGWVVSETSGPELRGPVLQGESCAPPALQQELLSQYEADWDALYQAGDPGEGRPADPAHPALAQTSIDPQRQDNMSFLTRLRDEGQVLRGRPDTQPSVLGVFDYDQLGVVVDCVVDVEGSGIYDADTGAPIESTAAGTSTSTSADLRPADGTWKVSNFNTVEGTCTKSGG